MKKLVLSLFITFSAQSFAGPGHNHSHSHGHSHGGPEISMEQSTKVGKHHVSRLVKLKKIDASWLEAKLDKSEMKNNEWVVTFNNDKGIKGKKLFVFLKKSGEFVAANFTGK